ncbi:hypothetical protein VPH526E571_0009 [Vibrio phage 526E57-1]
MGRTRVAVQWCDGSSTVIAWRYNGVRMPIECHE